MWQLESAPTSSVSGFDFKSSPPSSTAEELDSDCAPSRTWWAWTSSPSPPSQETPARWTVVSIALDLCPLRDSQQVAGLGDAGGAAADVFGHLPRLGDQLTVGLRHLAVRQVEVVLDPGADVAAEHQRGGEQ